MTTAEKLFYKTLFFIFYPFLAVFLAAACILILILMWPGILIVDMERDEKGEIDFK